MIGREGSIRRVDVIAHHATLFDESYAILVGWRNKDVVQSLALVQMDVRIDVVIRPCRTIRSIRSTSTLPGIDEIDRLSQSQRRVFLGQRASFLIGIDVATFIDQFASKVSNASLNINKSKTY